MNYVSKIVFWCGLMGGATMSFAATPNAPQPAAPQTTILAGGCFWCLEHDLQSVQGVLDVVSGYAGGDRPNPTYDNYHDLTATYKTPHIEVVKVTYDASTLPYEQLLQAFVRRIDPTDGEGQFCDRGPAYRPAIFAADEQDRAVAQKVLAATAEQIKQQVRVEILPGATFWPAEDYHQDYAQKNPTKYKYYRWRCGRDARIDTVWGK